MKQQELEWEPNPLPTVPQGNSRYKEEWPGHMINPERLILGSRDPGLSNYFHV